MARVVHQRSGPPYLLILMVFLFLAATTVAVLGYMKSDKIQEESEKRAALQSKIASSDDLRDRKVQQLISRYDSPPPGQKRKSVIKQMQSQISDLTRYVAGQEKDAELVIAEATAVLSEIGSTRSLAEEARILNDQVNILQNQLGEKDRLLLDGQQQLAEKDREIERIAAAYQARIDELQARVNEIDLNFSQTHDTYRNDLATAKQEWQKQHDDLNKEITEKTATIQEVSRTNADLGVQIVKLQERVRRETQPKADPMTVALKADGKILRVMPEEDICYINLGSKDNVTAGLSFTVYPSSGVTRDGMGKATIRITNVSETISECRLVWKGKEDPVVDGDLVANIAFDPMRTYTFVVIGNFDLHGTGQSSIEGTEEAKMLLKQFGGKVVDEVDINTDFVVVGQKPVQRDRPAESESPQAWQVYRDQAKIVERFDSTQALAQSLHIPILTINRFLAFIGYQSTQGGN